MTNLKINSTFNDTGSTNTMGGLIGGVVNLLAAIPRGIASFLDGMIGSSKKGDLNTLHLSLKILMQKLPSEISSGGQKVTLATMQTMLKIIDNLITSVGSGKTTGVVDVLIDIQSIIVILQKCVSNPGTQAILAKAHIQLSMLLNNMPSSGFSVSQITTPLQSVTASLTAVFNGMQSNSSTGGLTASGQRDLLQNVIFVLNLLQSQVSRGQSSSTSSVSDLLQQLAFLLDGVVLTTSEQASKNIIHSLSINLDVMLKASVSAGISSSDLLSLIKTTANSLNKIFDMNGISGTGNFIGGSTGSSTQLLQQISLSLNKIKSRISSNYMSSNSLSSVQPLILQLG